MGDGGAARYAGEPGALPTTEQPTARPGFSPVPCGGYLTEDGKHQRREFQGSRDDIRRQILAQKDLSPVERDQLLDGLSSRGNVFPFDAWAMVPLEHELLAAPAWWDWYQPNF